MLGRQESAVLAPGTATAPGPKGCPAQGPALLHTREPGQGVHGFDAPPGARPWFQYQPAGETARLPVHSVGPAGRR